MIKQLIYIGGLILLMGLCNTEEDMLNQFEEDIITMQANREVIDLDYNGIHDSICMCGYCIEGDNQ